jgi:malonyl CoA-acyl carrier protein transacylase
MEIAKAKGIKRAILLPVSAPFHCALMQPAADAMADALDTALKMDLSERQQRWERLWQAIEDRTPHCSRLHPRDVSTPEKITNARCCAC